MRSIFEVDPTLKFLLNECMKQERQSCLPVSHAPVTHSTYAMGLLGTLGMYKRLAL